MTHLAKSRSGGLARLLRDGPHALRTRRPRATPHSPGGIDARTNDAADRERGSAVVEFLGGAVVLLVPLVYLVLTLAQLQAGTFAAQAAARDAGRLVATADPEQAGDLAASAVTLAFADHGLQVDGAAALAVACETTCEPGERVHVSVDVDVPLPYVPGGGITVPVHAETWTTIDPFRDRP